MNPNREFAELVGLCWHETERRYVAGDIKEIWNRLHNWYINSVSIMLLKHGCLLRQLPPSLGH